ncbi:unnamed protein product [Rotaria magnacalcarata]|uniref:CWH43-like N-terminal domain-containing protein n=1 Tax=Rotaria magnacalcarata TaxID=392030 RepID=A0A820ESJ9_9BILA|nr:unnamed protein product [Rotaria magnacalcarata]CAF1388423.1 unnamed protein product [Rotaria magnacalcarata]CAF2043396.1 unnamed protein product [Rotaria magnacalcarata]CAF2049877.1 unnamed protein product [Rotaria magnacalcarata]CAF2175038.1 unnamed protein product [Rotaria magnacalcarata]
MIVGTISPSWQHAFFKVLGVFVSIVASLVWLATLVTLFSLWAEDDFVRYESDDGEVVYISNVGARHKSVFIVGTAITGILFVLTLIFTKLCFDKESRRRFKKSISMLSIIFGILSGISLSLLAILDSVNYKIAHYIFTGLFIGFTLLSAISSIINRFSRNEVNVAVNIRVLFVSMITPLVITFVVMSLIKRPDNETQLKSVAASLEWSIAFFFVPYLALFALDLLLSINHDLNI